MGTGHGAKTKVPQRWPGVGTVCCFALLCFVAGSVLTAWLLRVQQVRADGSRVFELMIYHTVPGKATALEGVFRDVSKLQAKYGLEVVGYWVPNDDPAWENTFIYLLAHPSLEQAKKNWAAMHADPAFPQYRSEAAQYIEKNDKGYNVDEIYMRASDFSALR